MALAGCYACLKYLMFVFNFIFWLVGCALLAVGIWAKVDESSFADVITVESHAHSMNVAAWVIIVVGAIIFILGFLGCCGAIRESQFMLATFFVFLFIIFAVLLAIGIYAYVKFSKDELEEELAEKLKESYDKYSTNNKTKKEIDEMHERLDCCGPKTGDCKTTYHAIAVESCGVDCQNREGCIEKAIEVFKSNMVIIVAVVLAIAVIMVLGMIFSMLLCCAIREVA